MKRFVICTTMLITFSVINAETQVDRKMSIVAVKAVGGGSDLSKQFIEHELVTTLTDLVNDRTLITYSSIKGVELTDLLVISIDSVADKVLLCVNIYFLMPGDALTPAAFKAFKDSHIGHLEGLGSLHYLTESENIPKTCKDISEYFASIFNAR